MASTSHILWYKFYSYFSILQLLLRINHSYSFSFFFLFFPSFYYFLYLNYTFLNSSFSNSFLLLHFIFFPFFFLKFCFYSHITHCFYFLLLLSFHTFFFFLLLFCSLPTTSLPVSSRHSLIYLIAIYPSFLVFTSVTKRVFGLFQMLSRWGFQMSSFFIKISRYSDQLMSYR